MLRGLGQPSIPNYNFFSPRLPAGVVALFWEWGLKVSKFQSIQISYFAYFYSMMCIITMRYVSLAIILVDTLLIFSDCKDTSFF